MPPRPICLDRPQVLDTTLRDGSYAINFQFSAADTSSICAALEAAGFDLIEVGHGVGLGASKKGYGVAAETDEVYCQAAQSALHRASYGMFCIPGVASLSDVDMAASHGMGFIRIGTNVTEVADSRAFIERSRAHGMFVCANFMKSYAVEPREFSHYARESIEYGAQAVYIVDSAGGMLPNELRAYINSVRDLGVPFAFHGHNNLGLAVGNSLSAHEAGAKLIDGSLLGMGRSAGNAPTEQLVAALQRQGLLMDIDLIRVLDAAAEYIAPLMKSNAAADIDLITGFAQFHSSYMKTIRTYAGKYRVDPRRLIVAVCAIDKVNAPPELVESVAKGLAGENADVSLARFGLHQYFGNEQDR